MDKKLQGKFMGCPYHGDDYESCIEYSGQAPCDTPDGWQLVPTHRPTINMTEAGACHVMRGQDYERAQACWQAMLAAAPKWGGE